MYRLEPFLPARLRLQDTRSPEESQPEVSTLLEILQDSRDDLKHHFGESVDLLSYMVIGHGRHSAVLHLVETILQSAVASKAYWDWDTLPSNLQWETPYLTALSEESGPVNVSTVQRASTKPSRNVSRRFTHVPKTRDEKAALAHVWRFLGALVVRSANSDPIEGQALLSIAHRALATMHHLNLIPDNVYNYSPTHLSSTIQRPPILHLLSSRMLTTLSDAVWRAAQDEAISEAASSGIPYRELGRDPPGGRFRLKVRDLGPEAWLELILWGCVESGCELTGSNMVSELLSSQADHPWFAVRWTDSSNHRSPAIIDWDRVKMRSGGTVGRIEGYSSEEPLVNIPPRTISVEVVLALVESLLNTERLKISEQKYFFFKRGKTISHLISFLEPHNLPPEYFDYLALRMLQIEGLDLTKPPELLDFWSRSIEWMRSLESTQRRPAPLIGFSFQSIIDHNEARAGLAHQALQAYLHAGYPNEAADVFNEIQRLVDSSKAQAISSFISAPLQPSVGFFSAGPFKKDPDFLDSHGQLPLQKVAAFLNMVTDNNLLRLGEWMLYSDDIDGPVIPRASFRHQSIAAALIRYSGQSSDQTILNRVVRDSQKWPTKPSIKYLRSLVNAYVRLSDIVSARKCLAILTQAEAGGYGVDNLAYLAESLLQLEERVHSSAAVAKKFDEVRSLMQDVLNGQYDGNKGSFYRTQILLFRQQIGHLLRIFDNIVSPGLNELSFNYMSQYPSGNAANLQTKTFDIILSAVVDTKGAAEGRRLWDMFCRETKSSSETDRFQRLRDYFVPLPESSLEDETELDLDVQVDEDQVDKFDSFVEVSYTTNSDPRGDVIGEIDDDPVPTSAISFKADLSPTVLDAGDSNNPIQKEDDPNPLVIPSIKTLRIITRGALLQLRDRHLFQGTGKADIESVLAWARDQFRRFGRTKSQTIKRELLNPLSVDEGGSEGTSIDRSSWVPAREREKVFVSTNFRPSTMTRVPWRYDYERRP